MPYGDVAAYRVNSRLVIEVEVPESGELSQRGKAENLVDPTKWIDCRDESGELRIKMTVCRPLHWRRTL